MTLYMFSGYFNTFGFYPYRITPSYPYQGPIRQILSFNGNNNDYKEHLISLRCCV